MGLPLVACVVLGLAPASTVFGVGLRLPNQDPEAIARGNAFVATADNPSAIYYNPAGITQLEGDQFQAGLYLISASTEYTSPSGGKAQTDAKFQPVPQLHYVHSFSEVPLSIGVGAYAPYGLSLDWGDNPPFGLIAQNGQMLYAAINPVIAWHPHPTLSIAAGPTINYSKVELENFSFRFSGEDVGFGFTAGLLWKPHQMWAFGAKYHSATDLDYSGNSDFRTPGTEMPTHAKAHFPQFLVGGVSFRPTKDWNLEFDLDWTDWDSLNQIVFTGTAAGPVPFAFNYRSSFMYEFGVSRQLGRGWSISAGYIFSENSSPDTNFNPIVPDSDLHLGSVGLGHKGKRWDWAIGYHFAYSPGREVRNSQPGGLADGTYRTFNNAINISATFKF